MRLVKDARLSLPLTEVMKIARLTSPLLDAPRQSSPTPRLRHGRRLALLLHLNLTLNLYTLFFALSLALFPRLPCLPPLLIFLAVLLPGNRLRSMPLNLRSHFSFSQPKAMRSRARGYLSELRGATCSEESHSSFCSPFSLAEFLAAASNLSSSTATGPDKVTYPMLKHLPRSGMDVLLHIFNLSWSLHSFPSIWKTPSIIPIHKMGKPLDSRASFRPISLTSCVSKLFERIILSRLLIFLESNSILFPRQAGFRPGRSTLHQILFLSQSISDGFNKPRPGSRTILSTKLLTLSGIPPFSTNSFWLASLLALLVRLNLSFLIGALLRSIKITKAVPFEYVEVFRKNPFLALYFSLSSLMIFRALCLLPSAALFTLTIWPFGPPPPRSPLRWRPHKELCFDWSAGQSTGVFLSIRANVKPPSSQWIPTRLTSSATSSFSAPTSASISLELFLGSPSTAHFPFLSMYLR